MLLTKRNQSCVEPCDVLIFVRGKLSLLTYVASVDDESLNTCHNLFVTVSCVRLTVVRANSAKSGDQI